MLTKKKNVSVAMIGAGSWATALVKILSENDLQINWWIKKNEDANYISRNNRNPRYLSHIHINLDKVKPKVDILKCIAQSDFIIFAIPAAFIKGVLDPLPKDVFKNKICISAIKGMIPEQNLLITDYLEQTFKVDKKRLAIVAGPCHAEEVAMEKKSYLTIAGNDQGNLEKIAALLRCRYVRASTNLDLYGIEYVAIIKNIIAIACGIAHGLNYGDNFQSVLVSNAMQEIEKFVKSVHPNSRDLNASGYLGDLLVTTYSQFSRNRTFGNMIGRGYSVKSAQMEMNMVAEGYYAVKCMHDLSSSLNIQMPIIKAVYHILYERISPPVEIRILEDVLS
ncbi:MAG TPA: NAD(P)H-dependent glycerol-3-phosphate dehydrogenase [Cytophagaceae bacterium]|jgi:glycerol-3-phosphate dehydrogenase (NAD(P)+)